MHIKRILASDIVVLESDVHIGGGMDVTRELREVLDEALVCGGVHHDGRCCACLRPSRAF